MQQLRRVSGEEELDETVYIWRWPAEVVKSCTPPWMCGRYLGGEVPAGLRSNMIMRRRPCEWSYAAIGDCECGSFWTGLVSWFVECLFCFCNILNFIFQRNGHFCRIQGHVPGAQNRSCFGGSTK